MTGASLLRALALAAICLCGSSLALAEGAASQREALFRDLSAETESTRTLALRGLEQTPELTEDEVRAALSAASERARPLVIRLAAARHMTGLVPEIVAAVSVPVPSVSDAAVRALVSLGDDAVASGLASLAKSKERDAPAVRRHLEALGSQRKVERAVLSRWRRKAGQYEGRYASLAELGWPVQPVLLAMLLDVPLTDDLIVLPTDDDPNVQELAKTQALLGIARSSRRGYRTFEPLPPNIEVDELFDLASQALKDVADLELMGDILEAVSSELQSADEVGWRLRRPERDFYRDIDVILFVRGRPDRLEALEERLRADVEHEKRWLADDPQQLQQLNYRLSEHAPVLHQLRRYDEAAEEFAEMIDIGKRLGGKVPAIAAYNRACALARRSAVTEEAEERADFVTQAITQLGVALDRNKASGFEDLTEEWVTEDGDLEAIRSDPRYRAVIARRFPK